MTRAARAAVALALLLAGCVAHGPTSPAPDPSADASAPGNAPPTSVSSGSWGAVLRVCPEGAGVEVAADASRAEMYVEVGGFPRGAHSFRLRVVDATGRERVNDTQPFQEDAMTQWEDVPNVSGGGSYWISWGPGGGESRFDPFRATPRDRMPC